MRDANIPKGAGFGRDANPRKPGLIDFGFTLEHGSRAQRRETLRQLQQFRRQGIPGAAEALADARQRLEVRAYRHWRVSLSGREPFEVLSPTPCTAAEIHGVWPGAQLEPITHD